MVEALAFNSVCQSVDFSNNGIGLAGVTQLSEVLKNNDALTTLSLATNNIGDDGASVMAKYLAGKKWFCSLNW